ncbi:FkbM family methyltransferase [Pelagimonas sp. KU-00592-HH]|uniref:FkbM family methyltransferase n=1 Tax=Pelagimonas sp. KU-00592-HH TaxID=3127651 RepID=UPI0031021AD7
MIDRETRALSRDEHTTDQSGLSAPFGSHAPSAIQRFLIGLTRNTILSRGKLRYRMSLLTYRFGKPLDIRRFGACFRIGLHSNLIEYGLLMRPTYNKTELDFLTANLGEGKVAIDIGSNIGLYSQPMALTGAHTVSIDANKAMVDALNFNANATGLKTIDVIHAAVGDTDGMASLRIHADDVAIVNVVEDAEGDVPIRRLDRILAEQGITRVDSLKIDVEGHEDLALAPFLESAEGDMIPDRIVIERVGPDDYPACTAAFERLGYKCVGRTRINSLYQRDAE